MCLAFPFYFPFSVSKEMNGVAEEEASSAAGEWT
jgi:hypothetical protein